MKMLTIAIVATAALALGACEKSEEDYQETADYHQEDGAKALIKAKLRDPDSAQFSNIRISDKGTATVVCGNVNSNNGFGGKAGAQRFISNGGSLAFLEEELEPAEWNEVWAKFC